MDGFRKILVSVDGSENSQRALVYAGYLAELCNAPVGVLHVVNLSADVATLGEAGTGGYVPDSVLTGIREIGQGVVDQALKQLPHTVSASGFLEIGLPTSTIVAFCVDNKYDLIVMGSRGLGAIKQLVLGSISSYVLHHAPCPVMVVK